MRVNMKNPYSSFSIAGSVLRSPSFLRGYMKTTVLGVRLNDYQREKLSKYGKEADVVRILVDGLIDGKIILNGDRIVPVSEVDLSAFEKLADKKRMSVQGLLDLIAELLS